MFGIMVIHIMTTQYNYVMFLKNYENEIDYFYDVRAMLFHGILFSKQTVLIDSTVRGNKVQKFFCS
jgi:hypothetical protein